MVTVFGLGFVGLTTALGFAHMGETVYGIDTDSQRKEKLKKGEIPFLEPQLQDVLRKHLDKNFFIIDDAEVAVKNSEYIFYCVGTPYGEDGSADLTYLFNAIETTIKSIDDYKFRVLVTKSTIPPSTTAEKIIPYLKKIGDEAKQIGVANNPEFLREGHCWEDFMGADRIVIGCNDKRSEDMLRKLYEPMKIPVYVVSHNTGEFVKYLSNTLLATMISYSNEMAQIADVIGDIDVAKAFKILHMDKRWNDCNMTSYVYPGCGYGGYCLPKDTNALFAQAKIKGYEPQILKNVIEVNKKRIEVIVEKIIAQMGHAKKIGILGLSFKPESDDVRDTPAYKIIETLNDRGYKNIVAFDPKAVKEFQKQYPKLDIEYCNSLEETYKKSDVLVIVTAWQEFRNIKKLGDKKVVDCRYMLSEF